MRLPRNLTIAAAVTFFSLIACGGQTDLTTAWMPAPECVILPGSNSPPDSIRIGLLGSVDPDHIPRADNPDERFLFSHLYETLIAIDCRGDEYALLAESWSSGERGRRWTFVVRDGIEFWDGTPVTARDIEWGWRSTLPESILHDAGIDSIRAEDERILQIYFDHRHRKVPGVLATLDFGVTKRSTDSRWPLGTGPYRFEEWSSDRSRERITLIPSSGAERPVLRFMVSDASEPRDLINDAVDMMITSDPSVLEYARSRPHIRSLPLNWDATYMLISTSRAQELRLGASVGRLSDEIRDGIAQFAVRGEARGYRPKAWWNRLRSCGVFSGNEGVIPPLPMGSYAISGFRRILYDWNDPVARGLAERIVALASTNPSTSPEAEELSDAVPTLVGSAHRTVAEGVTPDRMAASLRNGDDFAYVLPLPRRSTAPCYEYRKLIRNARWLAGNENDLTRVLIPLIDTRRHVIVRDDRIALSVDWIGTIRIERTVFPTER